MLEEPSEEKSPPESAQESQKQMQMDAMDPNVEKTWNQLEEVY